MLKSIPIVDLSKLSTKNNRLPSADDWNDTAKDIDKALSSIGFAYLVNHELDSSKINKAFVEAKKFFDLSKDIKNDYLKDPSENYHGYSSPGQELLHPNSSFELRESYDICGDKRYYPNEVPEFESAHVELENECKPLIKKLLKILAISLELDEDFFIKCSKYMDNPSILTYSAFRSIYYPCIGDDVALGTVRCAEHTDYGILTLLFQDLIGGLEVKTVEGSWAPANPIPGSVLINTGDLLEFWSNGHFPATRPQNEIGSSGL